MNELNPIVTEALALAQKKDQRTGKQDWFITLEQLNELMPTHSGLAETTEE
jgi:hypothetical protein